MPTWNYTAVHAYGVPRILEDPDELYTLLRRLVDVHEVGLAAPWTLPLRGEEYIDKTMRGTVGFEIAITRLEGKFKLSQNRSAQDRHQVAASLAAQPDPLAAATAALMGP